MSYIFSCDCTGTGFEGDLCENDIDECGSEVSNILFTIYVYNRTLPLNLYPMIFTLYSPILDHNKQTHLNNT